VRGIVNDEAVRGFADSLSVAPRPYHFRRDDAYFVVFCLPSRMMRKASPSASVASDCQGHGDESTLRRRNEPGAYLRGAPRDPLFPWSSMAAAPQ